MTKYVFGPVPSRRLGQSLGVDPVPFKTCNWNCVYCQLGRTRPLVNERQEFFPRDEILAEVRRAIIDHRPGEIDWVTFVGAGEPTLHRSLGWLIRKVQALTTLPVAVITNGALLYQPAVRRELAMADAVLPTLDAGNPELYRRINRPHGASTFARLLEGLVAFRAEFSGWLWPEVMLLRGLNDSQQALEELAEALRRIRPDEIHISLPVRPPSEDWVEPADAAALALAEAILSEIAPVRLPAAEPVTTGHDERLDDMLVSIVSRHPMEEAELVQTVAPWTPERLHTALSELAGGNEVQVVERYGIHFWSGGDAYYPAPSASRAGEPGVRRERGRRR